jgi:hypothetical protein
MDTRNIVPKTVVVVKRMWHSPEIHAFIDQTAVGAHMDLNDYTRALIEQLFGDKSRLMMLSKADALAKIFEAKDTILAEMKTTTANVV